MQNASVLVSSNAQLNPPQKTMPAAKAPTTLQGPTRFTQSRNLRIMARPTA